MYSDLPRTLREKITAESSLCWKSGVSLQHVMLAGKAGTVAVQSAAWIYTQCLRLEHGKRTEITSLPRTKQENIDGKPFLFTSSF